MMEVTSKTIAGAGQQRGGRESQSADPVAFLLALAGAQDAAVSLQPSLSVPGDRPQGAQGREAGAGQITEFGREPLAANAGPLAPVTMLAAGAVKATPNVAVAPATVLPGAEVGIQQPGLAAAMPFDAGTASAGADVPRNATPSDIEIETSTVDTASQRAEAPAVTARASTVETTATHSASPMVEPRVAAAEIAAESLRYESAGAPVIQQASGRESAPRRAEVAATPNAASENLDMNIDAATDAVEASEPSIGPDGRQPEGGFAGQARFTQGTFARTTARLSEAGSAEGFAHAMMTASAGRPNGPADASLPDSVPRAREVALQVWEAAARVSDKGGRIVVEMSPASLGRVEVVIERGEKAARVRVLVERADTLDAIKAEARLLERQLAEAGIDVGEGITFGFRGQGERREEASDPRGQLADLPAPVTPIRKPVQPVAARPGGIDILV